MFALIKNGQVVKYPYSLANLRTDNPAISFPKNPSDSILAEFDMVRIFFSTQPQIDQNTQALSEGTPVFNGERWDQTWTVRELTSDEIQERFDSYAAAVRSDRNQKLLECDWTQIADATVDKAAWAVYRQALRDITSQEGFPWSVDWPTQP